MEKTRVTSTTLAEHLNDPQWIIFDCRYSLADNEKGRQVYQHAHIPGAHYADLVEDLSGPITASSGRHPLPSVAMLNHKLTEWGVTASTQVVVYDDCYGTMAARMWWLLRWLGHEAVALLDGGLQQWQQEQRPLDHQLSQPISGQFVAKPNDDMWVDTSFVEQNLLTTQCCLFDARTEARFQGIDEPIDKVAGHIPGAVNMPFTNNLERDGQFCSSGTLRRDYQAKMIDTSAAQVILMCGSGVTACHGLLAMEQAGLTGAKLYVGSWSEWITDPRRPIVKA